MKSPIDAAVAHLESQMAQSAERLDQTTMFPFFHIMPDGHTTIFQNSDELAPFGSNPFRTEVIESEVVESGAGSAVIKLVFQRYDLNGKKSIKAKAIWGATETGDTWCIHWRQFLGQVQDEN